MRVAARQNCTPPLPPRRDPRCVAVIFCFSVGALVVNFGAFFLSPVFFGPFFLIRCFFFYFCALGCSRDPSGPLKTIKIVVLSSKIKVSLISKKTASGITFGAVWAHFWAHFLHFWPPWGSLGRPWALPWPPKGRQRPKKCAPRAPLPPPRWPKGAARTPS